jgi:hypothetical protein
MPFPPPRCLSRHKWLYAEKPCSVSPFCETMLGKAIPKTDKNGTVGAGGRSGSHGRRLVGLAQGRSSP